MSRSHLSHCSITDLRFIAPDAPPPPTATADMLWRANISSRASCRLLSSQAEQSPCSLPTATIPTQLGALSANALAQGVWLLLLAFIFVSISLLACGFIISLLFLNNKDFNFSGIIKLFCFQIGLDLGVQFYNFLLRVKICFNFF
jgi:hypothetical protein